jgi:hypothetical protein
VTDPGLSTGGAESFQELTSACVWRITPELVVALDDRFGEPLDAYVNGSQVWLRDDGPGDMTFEWRLHPVPGYRRPPTLPTDEVFTSTALAVAQGEKPVAPVEALWEGLEVFSAHGDEIEPVVLSRSATEALGIAPDAAGLVDHLRIGDEWEQSDGTVSIVGALLDQLAATD